MLYFKELKKSSKFESIVNLQISYSIFGLQIVCDTALDVSRISLHLCPFYEGRQTRFFLGLSFHSPVYNILHCAPALHGKACIVPNEKAIMYRVIKMRAFTTLQLNNHCTGSGLDKLIHVYSNKGVSLYDKRVVS